MNRIVITEAQKTSLLSHANNYAISLGYPNWQNYSKNVLRVDFSPILDNVLYDPDYFTGDAEPQYYLPVAAFYSPELSGLRNYVEGIVGDLSVLFSIVDVPEYQHLKFVKANMELRTGSSGDGITINENSIDFSDAAPLPILGGSLVQSVQQSLNEKEFQLRFKIDKDVLAVGSVGIGVGDPINNAVNQIKYFIGMMNLSDKIQYGPATNSLTVSDITHDNNNFYEIAYDGLKVTFSYSQDNCASWTEIGVIESSPVFPLRVLCAGQLSLGLGAARIYGIHAIVGF